MSTLNEDQFYDDNDRAHSFSDEPTVMNLVYGRVGWTDALSPEALNLLVSAGAIALDRTVAGPGWETRLYRSLEGVLPS